jgi:hypothetical protein
LLQCAYFDPKEKDRFFCSNDPKYEVIIEMNGSVAKENLRILLCDADFKKFDPGFPKAGSEAPAASLKILGVRQLHR